MHNTAQLSIWFQSGWELMRFHDCHHRCMSQQLHVLTIGNTANLNSQIDGRPCSGCNGNMQLWLRTNMHNTAQLSIKLQSGWELMRFHDFHHRFMSQQLHVLTSVDRILRGSQMGGKTVSSCDNKMQLCLHSRRQAAVLLLAPASKHC